MIRLNKAILTSFTILCLLPILFLTGCRISVKADLKILYVDDDNVTGPWYGTKEHPYQNITSGLEHASDRDTVFVHEGTYYEHVIVDKSVSLVGEDRDSTIVDGNETDSVISITANNVSVKGFTIKRSGDSGIFIDHYSGNDISHNIITNNNHGISLYDTSNNMISGNTITNNDCGIFFYDASNNMISGNTITNNNRGIRLYSSSNNMISGNTISSNNYDGIRLYSSSNNMISGNTITNNNPGIYLGFHSNDNTIHRNNFNNTYQVWTDSTNVWDDGHEGNYWSDYNGTDANQDGIGDTSYEIDADNIDHFPLMGMFSEFSVTHKEETYHVTSICNSTISEFRFEIGQETGNKIIRFNATGKDSTVGFCRVMIPTELMNYPYIVLVDVEEIVPTLLDVSNKTHVYLYFTYSHSSHNITIISSKMLYLYNELLDKHAKLQIDLYKLNETYYDLLNNHSVLLGYYSVLLDNYSQLQKSYRELNDSYYDLLSSYGILLDNYSQLQKSYRELNDSYQEHLLDYSENVHNIQNLTCIFAATTAIFIITTIYLSKRAHAGKTKIFEYKNRC